MQPTLMLLPGLMCDAAVWVPQRVQRWRLK